MVRYHASDLELWQQIWHTEYWNHNIWILPIHRPTSEHWVMSTLIPLSGEIHLFDSFGNRDAWEGEAKDIMAFAARLVIVVNQYGHPLHIITSSWSAFPTITSSQQTNGDNCGVRVLANIAAILSGFSVTGVIQSDIVHVRSSLLRVLAGLPIPP
ncbi:hypothetical protein DXG01_001548 [Tephrocybe rancida]|nr:hypothetical protein DXG01_001548 [Tephrocybe rancida]